MNTIKEAEEFFKEKYGNDLKATDSWVIKFAVEFSEKQRNNHRKGGIDLDKLAKKIDHVLETTSPEDMIKWLKQERNNKGA